MSNQTSLNARVEQDFISFLNHYNRCASGEIGAIPRVPKWIYLVAIKCDYQALR